METLVHDPFFVEVLDHFGLERERFLARKSREAWVAFEHGEIEESEYLRRFWKDGTAVDGGALRACLWAGYRWLAGMEQLLVELAAAGIEMHALSNYPRWYELIEAKLRPGRFLSWRFVSCRTGVRKPAPEAYLGAARMLGLDPGACLFIDDRAVNCAAAEAIGMPALRFTGAAAIRQELVGRGLLR